MAGSLSQNLHGVTVGQGQAGAQQYRSATEWPAVTVPSSTLAQYPNAGLWVPNSYASVWDVVDISLPEDSRHDWEEREIARFLLIGASRINERLSNRGWSVPLTYWSESVVWANCELAVLQWCIDAQNREITPDVRNSDAGLGSQAMNYVGTPARGWDQPRGYMAGGFTSRRGRY